MKKSSLKAIERLHRRDMRASAAGDFRALRALVDDEAVMFPPGGAPQRGAKEFDVAFERMAAGPKTHEVISYRLDFEEVKVFGRFAVEWGAIRGATREIATGRIVESEYHVMRVLRRQRNGSWKVYRSIWAPRVAPPAG
ncbi:MAG: nuclear transport factor 2 family protein [Steroidobacteraceae bacterium]|nr:nuclear transport factor 2 family protein [Steroidobacteraceae bacterium]